MNSFVTNVDRDQVFTLLKLKHHVYCYNPQTQDTCDLYYIEINNIQLLLSNERAVFFIINNGEE